VDAPVTPRGILGSQLQDQPAQLGWGAATAGSAVSGGWLQRRFTRSRCHRKMVAGVTIRCSRQAGDSNRVRAANTARSAQDNRGLLTWRRNTATSWRSRRISAFLDCVLRASSPSQARICRRIRYNSRTATTGDHARRPPYSDAAGHRRK
jgi:hypothetical protein